MTAQVGPPGPRSDDGATIECPADHSVASVLARGIAIAAAVPDAGRWTSPDRGRPPGQRRRFAEARTATRAPPVALPEALPGMLCRKHLARRFTPGSAVPPL